MGVETSENGEVGWQLFQSSQLLTVVKERKIEEECRIVHILARLNLIIMDLNTFLCISSIFRVGVLS